jgi:hypothetical protein
MMNKTESIDGFLLSGIDFQYSVVGDVRPLVDYLHRELSDKNAAAFIAKILTGEIKKGDSRKGLDKHGMSQAQRLLNSFEIRRLCADHNEREHGDPHTSNEAIWAELDSVCGYKESTAERMVKAAKSKKRG